MGAGDIVSGSIAGSTPDQNTFMLDGSNNTSGLEGDNGYINSFSGDQRGIVPTPIESISEVTVNTNNMTADFNTSSGGELLASTKRGQDVFHGAAYDFFQGDWLNSNSWGNNFSAVPKPKSHQNRWGFDLGGPMLPRMLGGKTYFFLNYEGQRYPFNTTGNFTRDVPSAMLRQGIIQDPDLVWRSVIRPFEAAERLRRERRPRLRPAEYGHQLGDVHDLEQVHAPTELHSKRRACRRRWIQHPAISLLLDPAVEKRRMDWTHRPRLWFQKPLLHHLPVVQTGYSDDG